VLSSANYGGAIEIAIYHQTTGNETPVSHLNGNDIAFGSSTLKCAKDVIGIHEGRSILIFGNSHYNILKIPRWRLLD
jgi:hypothetical protein